MVERILGKAEVGSSILPDGTIFPAAKAMAEKRDDRKPAPKSAREQREARNAAALKANLRRRKAAASTQDKDD